MVVLESGSMLTSGNQYLQPDYLSPLPTTLDAKKSPLALLAQTCSQIGADSPSSKPLLSTLDKSKKSTNSENVTRNSPINGQKDKSDKSTSGGGSSLTSRTTPVETTKLAFKPYESTVISKKSDESIRPSSKGGGGSLAENGKDEMSRTPGRKSASPASSGHGTTPIPESSSSGGKTSPSSETKSSSSPSDSETTPIIRSGLEILQGHPKDVPLGTYKPGSLSGLSGGLGGPLNSLCCPPGLEHHAANPAFRPPFPGGPYSHHAAMLAAGYPGAAAAATPGPFLSYARVKTPSGSEALVPVCKDPYCTGCQFSVHNQQLLMAAAAASAAAGPCPSGCTQCDHQKYNLAMAAAAMSLVPPGSVPPGSASLSAYPQLGRPYICNWVVGDTYCGKRFGTPDELLQHLRTHTSSSDAAAVAVSSAASSSLLGSHSSLFSTAALHRAAAGYPNPPLSPLSAARYHPYVKPSLPTTLGSPYSAFNPTLGPYYSAYSMYGQRIGAAVHP